MLAGVVAAAVAAAGCDTGEDSGNTDASGAGGASAGGAGGGAGTGAAGSGVAGTGVAGTGSAGTGVAGSGAAGTGVAGTGVAGSGAGGRGGVTGNAGTGGAAAGIGGSSDGGIAGAGDGGSTDGGTAGAGGRGGTAGGAGGRGGMAGGAAGAAGGGAGRGGAAGGVAGSGGGTGGAVAFNPCPTNGDACKVLPFGDSITDGVGSPSPGGGYRVDLFSRAVMANKKLTFVGQQLNGPTTVASMPFPRRHAGFSGYTIAQITAANIFDPAIGMGPNIVLLHIGTNDMNMSDPGGAPARLATLLDKLTTMAPNALIVVAKIIPLTSNMARVNTFNTAIAPLVQQRRDAGKHIILVDQNTGFPTGELGDGIHPNAAGYVRMAGVWYAAISNLLP